MSFRCFDAYMPSYRAGCIKLSYRRVNPDSGVTELCEQSQNEKLPSTDMTDLGAMLKAGVSLQQVNCKLLNPRGTVNLSGESSGENSQTSSQENKDEE